MTRYTATFAAHETTRKTDRTYTHAWIVVIYGTIYGKGFSGSAELAHKAAAAIYPKPLDPRDIKRNPRYYRDLAKQFGHASVTDWISENEKSVAAQVKFMTTEVVAVTT